MIVRITVDVQVPQDMDWDENDHPRTRTSRARILNRSKRAVKPSAHVERSLEQIAKQAGKRVEETFEGFNRKDFV